jgi:hypothetical protein
MPFTVVYAGTHQPLPEGYRVYAVEIGDDKLPKNCAFRLDVQAKGVAGVTFNTGVPRGLPLPPQGDPELKSKFQVIALPASQDFGSASEAYHALRRCPPLEFDGGRMPAVVLPGRRPDQAEPPRATGHTVRFRAVAKDGEELLSSAISLGNSGPGPRLAPPRWIEKRVRCGEPATLQVAARRLEGQRIFFDVEDDAGKPLSSVIAEVKDGQAVAQYLVPRSLLPPAKTRADEGKPGKKLRFHAVGPSEKALSGTIDVLPQRMPPKPK